VSFFCGSFAAGMGCPTVLKEKNRVRCFLINQKRLARGSSVQLSVGGHSGCGVLAGATVLLLLVSQSDNPSEPLIRKVGSVQTLDGPRGFVEIHNVIHVIAHRHKEIKEQFASHFHLRLHGAAALEGFAAADNKRQVMSAETRVAVRRVLVRVARTTQTEMEMGGKLFFDLFVAMCNHMDDIVDLNKSPRTI